MTSGDENTAGQDAGDDLSDWMRRGPYQGQPVPPAQSSSGYGDQSWGPAPQVGHGVPGGAPRSPSPALLPLVLVFVAGLVLGLLLGLLLG
jgi:hypothetical protein